MTTKNPKKRRTKGMKRLRVRTAETVLWMRMRNSWKLWRAAIQRRPKKTSIRKK